MQLVLSRTIHDVALILDREEAGRKASPTADGQTVKAPAVGAKQGYDAGRKTIGRKCNVVVDTDGRLLMVNLTLANIADSIGAQMIFEAIRQRWPRINHLFADGAYDRTQLMDKTAFLDVVVEVVRRSDKAPDFKILSAKCFASRAAAAVRAGLEDNHTSHRRMSCSNSRRYCPPGSPARLVS